MRHNDAKPDDAFDDRSEPREPITATWAFKAVVFPALVPLAAGVIATGAPIATHTAHEMIHPGVYYSTAAYDHSDPWHSDPGGEFTHTPGAEYGSTAITMRVIVGPGD